MSENGYSTSPTTYLPHNLTTYPPHHFTTYPPHHLPTSKLTTYPPHNLTTYPPHHSSPPTHFKTYHLPTSPPTHQVACLTAAVTDSWHACKVHSFQAPPPPLNTLQQQTHMCCTFSTCLLVLTQQEHTHSYSNCTYTCTYKHTHSYYL